MMHDKKILDIVEITIDEDKEEMILHKYGVCKGVHFEVYLEKTKESE